MAKCNKGREGKHSSTLLTALGWGILVSKKKFHFFPPRPPFLKVLVHHVVEGDGAFWKRHISFISETTRFLPKAENKDKFKHTHELEFKNITSTEL